MPPWWQFLRVETADGGTGEPIVEGRARTVCGAVEVLIDTCIVGEDPTCIDVHWQTMYRGGFDRGAPILVSEISRTKTWMTFERGSPEGLSM